MTGEKLNAKALLIDLDGTIVDPAQAFREATAAARSTVKITPRNPNNLGWEIARSLQRNLPLHELFDAPEPTEFRKEAFLNAFLQSFYAIAPHTTQLFPGADATLNELAGRFALALITRRRVPEQLIRQELTRLGIGKLFRTVVTALDVERPTPAPDALVKAADELHVPIRSCVVVSDSGVDIQAGKRAGATTIAVLSGLFEKEELREEKPDLIVANLNYLPARLQAL